MGNNALFLKRQVPFYYQNRLHGTCGPLSICMVVNSFRKPDEPGVTFTEYEYLIRKLMDSDIKGGVPTHKLPAGLRYFGMKFSIIEGDLKARLRKIREAIRRDCPVILNVHDSFGGRRQGHYVVVVGCDDEHLYLIDPFWRGEELNEHKKVPLAQLCKQSSRDSMVWGKRRWALKITGVNQGKS